MTCQIGVALIVIDLELHRVVLVILIDVVDDNGAYFAALGRDWMIGFNCSAEKPRCRSRSKARNQSRRSARFKDSGCFILVILLHTRIQEVRSVTASA